MLKKIHFILFFLAFITAKTVQAQCPSGDVAFHSQLAINNFISQYPNCTTIHGDVEIEGTSVVSLTGLRNLINITGDLKIKETGLFNLDGLQNLRSIGGELSIKENRHLQNLFGLNNLVSIGEELQIKENPVLTSIDALSALTHIGNGDEAIEIEDNDILATLQGLGNNATVILGDIKIKDNQNLSVCAVASICGSMNSLNFSVSGNSEGCNSSNQLQTFCSMLSTTDSFTDTEIRLLQNPVSDCVEFINNTTATGQLILTDVWGSTILKMPVQSQYNNINIENFTRGIYLLTLRIGIRTKTYKIIKR